MPDEIDRAQERAEAFNANATRRYATDTAKPVMDGGRYVCAECGEDNQARGRVGLGRCYECQMRRERYG